MCHNDAMNGGATPKTDCCGGPDCPLGVDYHPPANSSVKAAMFSLGCSLCRSEKLECIVSHNEGNGGFNVEQRADMKERFDHVLGHNVRRNMKLHRGKANQDEEFKEEEEHVERKKYENLDDDREQKIALA